MIVKLIIAVIFCNLNVVVSETNENLVSIETDTNNWNFNSTWDTWECNNYSTGNATSDAYVNSTIGYIYGQPKMNETGCGQAEGWMIHSVEWDCPVDNESGVINISYEYGAFAFLRVNSSGYAHAKLCLTFFIDDMQHEVIIYNNTIDEINETANFSADSIANWSKNLTLSNKTYVIGVNASYEIEYTGNDTQSIAWLSINIPDTTTEEGDSDTEYWAVLIGVDAMWETWNAIHIPFDENAEEMYKMLLVSDDLWQEDHIKVLTNEEATWVNIIEALLWLDSMDDGDDISLVYYTAHGANFHNFTIPLPNGNTINLGDIDWPPEDEEDGYDEYLTTYRSKKILAPITDDLFNSLIDRLDSEGVAVIIDACFSGGMIDSDKSTWITEFSGEMSQDGRVIVTSSAEEEKSTISKGITFSDFTFAGLQGYADNLSEGGNDDGIVSIEEAFKYADPRYENLTDCEPQCDDRYSGELVLTEVERPPSKPILYGDFVTFGQPGTSYVFNASSTDPENNTIKYSWNWTKDGIAIFSYYWWGLWEGYDVDNCSGYHSSGDNCTMLHSWDEPGVYAVRVKAQDQHGAERIDNFEYSGLWSKPRYFLINSEDEIVDQYQLAANETDMIIYGSAQSFVPNASTLSKIKLKLIRSLYYDDYLEKNYTEYPLNVSIRRSSLDSENLTTASKNVSTEFKKCLADWVEFDFSDIKVIPNDEQYFIVIECDSEVAFYQWANIYEPMKDYYPKGEAYERNPSGGWYYHFTNDLCFITYESEPADAGGPYYVLLAEQPVQFNGSAFTGNQPYNWSWDFGDGNTSTLQNPTHTYATTGNYTVNLTVNDSENLTTNDTTWVNIRDYNNPPYAPDKPSGPTICKKNMDYEYSTNATDPDGDKIYYKWDWNDNTTSEWLGPAPSGQTHVTHHKWSQWGLYKVRVKAKDVYGGEGNWSDKLWVYVRLLSGFDVSPSAYLQSSQTVYFNDYSQSYYEIVNWTWNFGDGNFAYAQNTSHTYTADGVYNVTLTVTDNMSVSNVSSQSVYIDSVQPEITSITDTPDTVGFSSVVDIDANVFDNLSGVNTVRFNVTYPDNSCHNFTMSTANGSAYEYIFSNTWLVGQYNYTIWVCDKSNNSVSSSGHSFSVSTQATISVCTIKDEYGNNEIINLTDPPVSSPELGYELLDDGDVLHIWNKYDSYYFDTSSGIQLTNHYDEYWSHNVMMLGYYNNDEWNLIYRTDELSGFNKNIDTDNETYVNATLWKDLTYGGYDFRLAIRYHLGVDDNELTVIPYIKNLGEAIPYTLGFGWEMKDIQIDMTSKDDYIEVNRTMYYLNQTLDNTYTDLLESEFYLMENITDTSTKSLYLRWNRSLTYKLQVKSRDGQYNAPVTLFVRIGTLNAGQEKHTRMYWYDADQVTYYFDSYDDVPFGEAWATNPSYMVDGNPSNPASTTTNSDVELCDGNNCSGSYLGEISKVEIRASGYYSGTKRDIFLRPVFGGTTDGMDYRYETSNFGLAWSPWFDITNDPYAPQSWTWTDVDNLDCDVEVGPGALEFTLYCSKVEMRVTYTPNDPPGISNPYPADGSNGISISPALNITVSDADGDNMNIIWLSNSSGSWQVFGTNNSVGNGTYHQTFSNATENGKWWYWKVNVTDGTNYTESGVYKFYTGYQSKIKNTGSSNIKGYLLIQVQYYNETSQSWVVAADTINETSPRTINSSEQLGLDTVFNGLVNTSNLSSYGNGTYRVYAAFRDPDGNILVTDDETELVATYEFDITFD